MIVHIVWGAAGLARCARAVQDVEPARNLLHSPYQCPIASNESASKADFKTYFTFGGAVNQNLSTRFDTIHKTDCTSGYGHGAPHEARVVIGKRNARRPEIRVFNDSNVRRRCGGPPQQRGDR